MLGLIEPSYGHAYFVLEPNWLPMASDQSRGETMGTERVYFPRVTPLYIFIYLTPRHRDTVRVHEAIDFETEQTLVAVGRSQGHDFRHTHQQIS